MQLQHALALVSVSESLGATAPDQVLASAPILPPAWTRAPGGSPLGDASPEALAQVLAPASALSPTWPCAPGERPSDDKRPSSPGPTSDSAPIVIARLDCSQAGSTSAPGQGSSTAPLVHVSPTDPPQTRLQDGIHKPKQYTDDTIWYTYLSTSCEPYNLQEALATRH
jgi:hypothetical protein